MTRVTFSDGTQSEVALGTPLLDLLPSRNGVQPIVGALVDRDVLGLDRVVRGDCRVEWLTPGNRMGIRFIRRSLSFILAEAARDLFPEARLVILHSLSKGFFCELHRPPESIPPVLRVPRMAGSGAGLLNVVGPVSREDVRRLEQRMREIVAEGLPFTRVEMPREEAIALFERHHRPDLVRLFRYRANQTVDVQYLRGTPDYFHGDLVPTTADVGPFELRFYAPGFILRFPEDTSPADLPAFVDTARLSKVFYEFKKWSHVLEVPDVGAVNDVVASGEINDFIRVAEALQEKKIAQMADAIGEARERIRLVLIAGPSASGKTTFAQRLSVQLRVIGLKPIPISLDDYYVEREKTPLDEFGEYDYENVVALDLPLLNEHLRLLTFGEPVRLPRYNFKTGLREFRRNVLQLAPGQLLVVEGIHALNELLTESIPKPNKYKVYISALTQLNLDDHNRVPTTDTRLVRRIARDIQFRGIDAQQTLARWRSVRRGEERWIFPFQEEADVMFNSGLFYELGALRTIVEPLLHAVPRSVPEYTEARRLLQLLTNFLTVGTEEIPPNSILREFIGATCFFRAE